VSDDLAQLRAEVAKADEEIRRAILRRLKLAREIGLVKQDQGLPLRDFLTERAVLGRWKEGLAPGGVSSDRAETLAAWLVEESVRVQESVGEPRGPPPPRSDILVVGGLGQMGGWLRDFFRDLGHRVGVLDPRTDVPPPAGVTVHTDLRRAAQDADVVIIATPMRAAPAIYRELLRTETEALLFDVLSFKSPIVPLLRRGIREGFRITSVHPLFGPGTRTLLGRNLLVLDCGHPEAARRAAGLFAPSSVSISVLPLETHDEIMADALALPHAVSLLFGLALRRRPSSTGGLGSRAPTSFRRQLEVAHVVTGENPELSFDIQSLNPHSEVLFERLGRALQDLRSAIEKGDVRAYQALLREAHEGLDRERPPVGGRPLFASKIPGGEPLRTAGRPIRSGPRSDDSRSDPRS